MCYVLLKTRAALPTKTSTEDSAALTCFAFDWKNVLPYQLLQALFFHSPQPQKSSLIVRSCKNVPHLVLLVLLFKMPPRINRPKRLMGKQSWYQSSLTLLALFAAILKSEHLNFRHGKFWCPSFQDRSYEIIFLITYWSEAVYLVRFTDDCHKMANDSCNFGECFWQRTNVELCISFTSRPTKVLKSREFWARKWSRIGPSHSG